MSAANFPPAKVDMVKYAENWDMIDWSKKKLEDKTVMDPLAELAWGIHEGLIQESEKQSKVD